MVDAGIFPGSIAAVFGLMIGSFLNVVIYRLPRNESIVFPGSHCTSCGSPIRWYYNIPLISYFLLRGKCANCQAPFSVRYPFVEALNGGLWFWSFYSYLFPEAILFALMASLFVIIAFVDIDFMVIPLVMILIAAAALIIYNLLFPEHWMRTGRGVLVGVCYLGGVYLLTRGVFKKETMGMGDLQLIAVLGGWLGPLNIAATIFAGSVVTLAAFGIVMLRSGKAENRALPFGPFLAFSGIAVYMIKPNWNAILAFLR